MLCRKILVSRAWGGKEYTGRTELGCELAVNGCARPVVGPCHIPILAERNHGLNREGHARLALSDRLVLGVMGDVGRTVEYRVDAVADICSDDAAVLGLGVGLNGIAKVAEQGARLHQLDGLVEALASRLDHTNSIRVRLGSVADVVCLVEIAVVALVVERDVEVDDVAVEEYALVGNAVADDLVQRGTDRLGEVVVV